MKKSFFLIFSLWLFFLLSLFCLGLGFRTLIAVKKMKLLLNKSRAFYLAVSGIKLAHEVLGEDEATADYLEEKWAQPLKENMVFFYPAKSGMLSVRIEDESSRININEIEKNPALRKSFIKLLEEKGIEGPEEKVNFLLDYIDEDEVFSRSPQFFGAEEDVKNEKLSVAEELLLVKNFSKEDYEKIKNFVSVFTLDAKININTCSLELLDILIEDHFLRDEVLKVRLGLNLTEKDADDRYYGRSECINTDKCEVLPLELKNLFKVNSNFFRIISEAEVENVSKKVTCVVERPSVRALYKILYWFEE